MKKTFLTLIYSVTALFRQAVIFSGFGFESRCKHSPSCGQYFTEKVLSDGILIGTWKGATRLLSCW